MSATRGRWLRPEEERDGVLLDLAPRLPRTRPWVVPLLAPLAIATVVMAIIASDPAWLLLGAVACIVAVAALWAPRTNIRARLLLCEDGLWWQGELVSWERLDSYSWRPRGILELIRIEAPPIEIPVLYEKREAVDEILDAHGVQLLTADRSAP